MNVLAESVGAFRKECQKLVKESICRVYQPVGRQGAPCCKETVQRQRMRQLLSNALSIKALMSMAEVLMAGIKEQLAVSWDMSLATAALIKFSEAEKW